MLNSVPLEKGVGKGYYLQSPCPARGSCKGNTPSPLRHQGDSELCSLWVGLPGRAGSGLRKVNADCGLGSPACLGPEERRPMACVGAEAGNSCCPGKSRQDRRCLSVPEVATWGASRTGLNLGSSGRGKGTSADRGCKRTAGCAGAAGGLVRKP